MEKNQTTKGRELNKLIAIKTTHIPTPTRLRDGAFNQAMASINTFAGENLTVKGLVHQTGVSEKTLDLHVFFCANQCEELTGCGKIRKVKETVRGAHPMVTPIRHDIPKSLNS